MKRQKKRSVPVFFAACIVILSVFNGCGREAVYWFETSDSAGLTESGIPAGDLNGKEQTETEAAEDSADPEPPEPETIWVYVCGAVHVPGVYELPADGRVFQALDAAGGPLDGAELRSLNQAALLTDGEQITVYTAEEIEGAGGVTVPGAGIQTQNSAAGTGRVNINTAGREELMTLSGIGEARAQAIISYREEHGPFTAVEEVMNIEGIKEKAFSKIKDEIEV